MSRRRSTLAAEPSTACGPWSSVRTAHEPGVGYGALCGCGWITLQHPSRRAALRAYETHRRQAGTRTAPAVP